MLIASLGFASPDGRRELKATMRHSKCGSTVRGLMLVLGSMLASGALPAAEVNQRPQPLPYAPPVAAPQDRPFDGTIRLDVDARDVQRRMFRIKQTIPVQKAGPLTLLYPEWEPSSHARSVSVANLAGLVVHAGSQRLEWRRDELDMHAFHVQVPTGAKRIDVEFQYITRAGDALLRPDMVLVQWQRMLLYPAGWFARNIAVQARLHLPQGLKAVSSLQLEGADDDGLGYAETSLETLMDAPVIAARHSRSIGLGAAGEPPLRLHLLADTEDGLDIGRDDLGRLRRLAGETRAVFGPAPYRHFDAMVVLSDAFPAGGYEHAESAEVYLPADFFHDPSSQLNSLDLIAHEHVHAWNGRARVPAGQWTPTPNVPIRNSLLWVYEGQTEFWGRVLAARSGLRGRQDALDRFALDAAEVQVANGRAWKTLRDTVNDPLYVSGRSNVWPQWQRRKDYYTEGIALWLDVEMTLRERSNGRLGLDDFARRFFAVQTPGQVSTYGFEDVCQVLNGLLPMDWSSYLDARLDAHEPVVLDGLAKAGWSLVFDPHPSETFRQHEKEIQASDLTYSVGMVVTAEGAVRSVLWDSAAFKAGLAPGAKLLSVNGSRFSLEHLLASIDASGGATLVLDYEMEGVRSTAELRPPGGLRYPRLKRLEGTPDRLSALLTGAEAGRDDPPG
jgi:predicted metalloprotease with PDZ domain